MVMNSLRRRSGKGLRRKGKGKAVFSAVAIDFPEILRLVRKKKRGEPLWFASLFWSSPISKRIPHARSNPMAYYLFNLPPARERYFS
jgi:hypothetical protein